MDSDGFIKLPRLYVESGLSAGGIITLPQEQAHYLRNVLRIGAGGRVRLFNGRDGEWAATVETSGKKEVSLRPEKKLKDQPPPPREVRLFFTPIKKARMDWLVEKAVELGVTHLHPVLTQNTDVRAINEERVRAQIIEATEQCERMDIPVLAPLQPLFTAIQEHKILACVERTDAPPLHKVLPPSGPVAILIGPEGGFSAEEKEKLSAAPSVGIVSLGPRILRAETAALVALCQTESETRNAS
ncbi:MAG TPA: 16S rRNA (uracil(1498)-N(3))-methyltransferase [Alphaproteobacteria bacterium]|jgi:16S rRNA (uracil1498-N3)-methyltransferase